MSQRLRCFEGLIPKFHQSPGRFLPTGAISSVVRRRDIVPSSVGFARLARPSRAKRKVFRAISDLLVQNGARRIRYSTPYRSSRPQFLSSRARFPRGWGRCDVRTSRRRIRRAALRDIMRISTAIWEAGFVHHRSDSWSVRISASRKHCDAHMATVAQVGRLFFLDHADLYLQPKEEVRIGSCPPLRRNPTLFSRDLPICERRRNPRRGDGDPYTKSLHLARIDVHSCTPYCLRRRPGATTFNCR